MRKIILDTETTGLSPLDGHRIIEIGCVELNGKEKGDSFQVYINPERRIPQEAINIHGITNDFLENKPKFSEIAKDFLDFIANDNLVIHNANFDMSFLNHELRLCGLSLINGSRAIDTLTMARKKFPKTNVSLDALCKMFSINISHREKHGALKDADLLLDVYLELLEERQSLLFPSDKKEEGLSSINKSNKIPYREFQVSEEELKTHKEFISNIENSIWSKIYKY